MVCGSFVVFLLNTSLKDFFSSGFQFNGYFNSFLKKKKFSCLSYLEQQAGPPSVRSDNSF